MKLVGAAAILLGSLLAALTQLNAEKTREETRRALRRSLILLRNELYERQTILPEAFPGLAGASGCEAAQGFYVFLSEEMRQLGERSFSAIWRDCAGEKLAMLDEEDTEAIASLGTTLGGSELELQCAALEKCADTLERKSAQCAAERAEKRKMTLGVTLSLGAFVIILLI